MPQNTALVWLRNDLRLSDNPALSAAFKHGDHVIALYVHETDPDLRAPGGASRWWLHHSLQDLGKSLAEHGARLIVSTGEARQAVGAAVSDSGADAVFWNRRYAPAEVAIDLVIKDALKAGGIPAQSFAANVLVEPWSIKTKTGNPYSVYTPFWNTLKASDIAAPLRTPVAKRPLRPEPVDADYAKPKWAAKLDSHWQIGESAAHKTLSDFLDDRLDDYAQGRDFPAREATSKLSPHLRFGEISPRQIWHAAQALALREPGTADAVNK
ncbi:MAG: deoxyribodipyrimidine photolyase, partial [Devosia sp.]|nr:deoxyribodipyrimidine photolyase [Devosia sp.]